jgi:mitochondrial FAD-linked sulfhydryl oxidase
MADQPSEPPKAPPRKLPPGMFLGPDGKPCRTCNSLRDLKAASSLTKAKPGTAAKAGAAAAAGSVTAAVVAAQSDARCPPDVEQLGRSTWTFLHTTAAYYPERPTPLQRANMLSLLHALPVLYPCSHCATHLGEEMKSKPPDVSGRVGLSRWLCEAHNEVNGRLGKPQFDCSIKSTDERWKDGPSDGSCD